jgi:hypothetical protein
VCECVCTFRYLRVPDFFVMFRIAQLTRTPRLHRLAGMHSACLDHYPFPCLPTNITAFCRHLGRMATPYPTGGTAACLDRHAIMPPHSQSSRMSYSFTVRPSLSCSPTAREVGLLLRLLLLSRLLLTYCGCKWRRHPTFDRVLADRRRRGSRVPCPRGSFRTPWGHRAHRC